MTKTRPTAEDIAKSLAAYNPKGELALVGSVADVPAPKGSISTGLLSLDAITGGGIPKGRITQLTGETHCGKTTLALKIASHTQHALDENVLWIDLENAWSDAYAAHMGVDLAFPKLVRMRPTDGETVMKVIDEQVIAGHFGLIVIDSIGAIVPSARYDSEPGKKLPAIRAQLVTEMVERIIGTLGVSGTTLLAINHETGTMKSDYHNNEITVTKGGKSLSYLTSLKIMLKKETGRPLNDKGNPIKDGETPVTQPVRARTDKNRMGAHMSTATIVNILGQGFDILDDLVRTAVKVGTITMNGTSIYVFGDRKWQGKAKLIEALADDAELFRAIDAAARAELGFEDA